MNWEVRTMPSKTLSSERTPCPYWNGELLRRNLTRFWPLWAVYAAVWLVAVPLVQFVNLFGNGYQGSVPLERAYRAASDLLNMVSGLSLFMAVSFGCLFAMALFSYLCAARSVGMLHSFPIRREGLFLTNYLTGVAVFVAVDALTVLLTAAIQSAAGVLDWGNLLAVFACAAGEMLFFYSFACFCAMFTGQILAIPAFYGILNVLAVGLNVLVQNFAGLFFYGYSGGGTPMWVRALTPVWKLGGAVNTSCRWEDEARTAYACEINGLGTVGAYAVAGAVFAALALLVCRTRRSEAAGDTVTANPVKPIFRWGVGLCAALSLGQGLYLLVWERFRDQPGYSLPGILLCMILLGLVGYFAAEMLLKKSFRVLRSGWRGAAALVVVLALFGVGVSMDFTGVERRVPAADTVASLDFSIGGQNYLGGAVRDEATIEKFTALHQAIIAGKDETQSREKAYEGDRDGYNYAYLNLDYTLKNGSTVSRSYQVFYVESDLQNPDGAVSRMAALATDGMVQRASLLPRQVDAAAIHVTGGSLNYVSRLYDDGGYETAGAELDGGVARALYDALMRDMDAGHLGANQFDFEAWQEETYVNDLTFYCTYPDPDSLGREVNSSFSLQISSNCTELIAALRDAGVLSDTVRLTTMAEANGDGTLAEKYAAASEEAQSAPAAAELPADVGVIGGADGPTAILVS